MLLFQDHLTSKSGSAGKEAGGEASRRECLKGYPCLKREEKNNSLASSKDNFLPRLLTQLSRDHSLTLSKYLPYTYTEIISVWRQRDTSTGAKGVSPACVQKKTSVHLSRSLSGGVYRQPKSRRHALLWHSCVHTILCPS